jgi:hypothetical protein
MTYKTMNLHIYLNVDVRTTFDGVSLPFVAFGITK